MKPVVEVTLRPAGTFEKFEKLHVRVVVRGFAYEAGDELFCFHRETVTIPFCPLHSAVVVSDPAGAMPFTTSQSEVNFQIKEHFQAARASEGDLTIAYTVAPRIQPEGYRSSPYFDLVAEEGGVNGAGLTFLPMLPFDACVFRLRWDLSQMPEGCRGIWSLGEGDVEAEIAARQICFSYYACGDIKSFEQDNYGIYWFADPPFDVQQLAESIGKLFREMSRIFEDEGLPYKIFLRRNAFSGSGGTAACRAYLMGYSPDLNPTATSLTSLLAHEMVHNWPHIEDEPYGTGNWYSEGTAQFYSVLLPSRLGLVDLEYTRAAVQKAADDYYANPARYLSFQEAAKLFWIDRNTQRIPYGRGFIYLANLDAAIRRASDGAHSLDDLVRDILRLQRQGEKVDNEGFLELASAWLGRDARPEWVQMVSGELLAPDPDMLDGLFSIEETEIELEGFEEPQKSYLWRIRGKV